MPFILAQVPQQRSNNHHSSQLSQLRPTRIPNPPRSSAIIPPPLVILLRNRQIGQSRRHDAPRRAARDDAVPREVRHAGVLAQEVLVEEEAAVHEGRGGGEHGEDGVGEDGCVAEVSCLGGVGLC